VHAPGIIDDAAAAAATHHLLLAHGMAVQALRSVNGATPVGVTLDMHPVRLADDGQPEPLELARLTTDAEVNGLFLEPVLYGRYPEHARTALLPAPDLIADGDLATISQPVDLLGVNYYSPVFLRAGDPDDLRRLEEPARCQLPGVVEFRPADLDRTAMDWLVDPDGLYELLLQISDSAPALPLYITENGCASEDYVDASGAVNDVDRIGYLHQHLAAAGRALKAGVNLAGYHVWSLLDNFEWAWGYQRRFGIVFVDFETQRRIPKQSAKFYGDVVRANAVPPFRLNAVV
jgi:beta-glucosidase